MKPGKTQPSPNDVTMVSLKIKPMYLFIKYGLIKKAIDYFMASFSTEDKKTIEICCRMIQFGMSSLILVFQDKYFEYEKSSSIDEKGLVIKRYKSAFLADLVASYLLNYVKIIFTSVSITVFFKMTELLF